MKKVVNKNYIQLLDKIDLVDGSATVSITGGSGTYDILWFNNLQNIDSISKTLVTWQQNALFLNLFYKFT